MKIFLDSGPLIALVNDRDEHHEWAQKQLSILEAPGYTCESALGEVYHLTKNEPGGRERFLHLLRSDTVVSSFDYEREKEYAIALMERYSNVPMDFTDACLVYMAEMAREYRILTTDSDFFIYRIHENEALKVIHPTLPS